jgi:prepilin-type N-terminal cleavage/methylation domain-containing protein
MPFAVPFENFRRPARGAGRRPGFTLLELLVALAMAAIIAVALYSTLRIAFKADASARAAVEPVRTAELALSLLRSDIEGALPPKSISLDGTTGSQTDGTIVPSTLAGPFLGTPGGGLNANDADYLEFYTTGAPSGVYSPAPAPSNPLGNAGGGGGGGGAMGGGMAAGNTSAVTGVGGGEVRRVAITALPDPNAADGNPNSLMVVRRVTENLLAPVEQPPMDEVLCRGVRSFRLRYFDGTQWVDSWDSTEYQDELPPAVEVTIELERPGGPDGQPRVLRFPRVFLLSCSTLVADANAAATSGTGTSTTGGSSTTGR